MTLPVGQTIVATPLTASGFAEFGEVLEAGVGDHITINRGMCERYGDQAKLDFARNGRPGISIFLARPRVLPYELDLVERHPHGSQAFIPMEPFPFLVSVAPDLGGKPGRPRSFITNSRQGINFRRATWHGVLTPLEGKGLFAVVDWIGNAANLVEHRFDQSFWIVRDQVN